MMHELQALMPALAAGLGLGVFFFAGLWWTVRRGISSPHPALWFCGSLLLRTGIALLGFYLVAGDDWQQLLASLLGFVIARFIVTRLSKPPVARYQAPEQEDVHAPQS